MKTKCVHIKPNLHKKGWEVTIQLDDEDRVKPDMSPCNIGFVWVPQSMPNSKAITLLKNHMINTHIKEIARITDSLQKLQQVDPKNCGY